jgi:acyl carrier protein
MSASTAERVIKVVATLKKIPPERVGLDSNLRDLGVDSLDAINLLFELETEFSISIADEFTQGIVTVRQIVDKVSQLLPQAASNAG